MTERKISDMTGYEFQAMMEREVGDIIRVAAEGAAKRYSKLVLEEMGTSVDVVRAKCIELQVALEGLYRTLGEKKR